MGERVFFERMENANTLLKVISSVGRRFFYHKTEHGEERLSHFCTVDDSRRIWFVDKYAQNIMAVRRGGDGWRGFSEGGTLRSLVLALADYIRNGKPIASHFGPWAPDYCGGDLWGYGDTMETVRNEAQRLGIWAPAPPQRET